MCCEVAGCGLGHKVVLCQDNAIVEYCFHGRQAGVSSLEVHWKAVAMYGGTIQVKALCQCAANQCSGVGSCNGKGGSNPFLASGLGLSEFVVTMIMIE